MKRSTHPRAARALGLSSALLAALLLLACDRPAPGGAAAPSKETSRLRPPIGPTGSAAPPSPAPPPLAPPPPPRLRLEAPGPFVELPVAGHPAAVVSLPLGAEGRRPVVIATHGNYDRPEWQCEVWRGIIGDRAFILCPRGAARADSPSPDDIRFTYSTNQALGKEVDAGLEALQAAFPDHVDGGAVLYTGFSLGAIMGVAIASRAPGRFPRLILVEGGHDRWTAATAKAFAAGGGLRVLFVCAQAGCAGVARQAAAHLEKSGVATRVAQSKPVGHRYDGPVADEVKKALDWALEGDGRWRE